MVCHMTAEQLLAHTALSMQHATEGMSGVPHLTALPFQHLRIGKQSTLKLKMYDRMLEAVRARFATLVFSVLHSATISAGGLARGYAPFTITSGSVRAVLSWQFFQLVRTDTSPSYWEPQRFTATFHLHAAHGRSIMC